MESNKECAYWSSGIEVDESGKGWAECKKNPGHENFIPVGKFGIKHLPSEWQSEDLVKFIKVWSDLTVRLRVNCKITDGKPGDGARVGTGFVWKVKPTDGQTDQRSWIFYINTAKHVIDDDSDFKSMGVDFYHDDVNSLKDGRMKTLKGGSVVKTDDKTSEDVRMKTLKGGSVVRTRDERDWRQFTCLCYDEELAVQMMDQLRERERLHDSLSDWLFSLSPRPAIFVSHPHGGPKYVTVGEERGGDWDSLMFTYTTDTCPGSSGSRMVGFGLARSGTHHCQRGEGGLNVGFSGWWRDL